MHSRAATGAQTRQVGLPCVTHRRAQVHRGAGAGRPSARRAGQARVQTRQGPRDRRGRPQVRVGDAGPFEQTRPMVAAQALGIARAALEYMTDYANRREAFGAPIIDNQGIAFPIAEIATQIDAARLLTWRASWMAAT